MPAPATTSNLVDFIRKSGLLDKARIEEYFSNNPGADELPPVELAQKMVADGILTEFQSKHLMKGRYRNFFIGKFKVLEPLGSGGMSQVYLCEHAVMKHRVAMKLLPIRENEDKAAVGRFMREARAAAAVNHPNVVRAHDFDLAEKKFYYLIMDYVDGINLHDLVKKIGPLPPSLAANFICQAASGLQHIHECGLIHRDLKPSNLLVDRSGMIRLLDLGLARFTDDDRDNLTRQLQGKSILGTADFLAPEQAILSDDIDIRADIYSLGATLYFLLSGRAPFESQSVTQKLLAHQIREPDPIPGIPDNLSDVIKKMMQKSADDRYTTPNEIVEILNEYIDEIVPPPEDWFTMRAGGAVNPASTSPSYNRSSPSTANLGMNHTPVQVQSPSSRKLPPPSSSPRIKSPSSSRINTHKGPQSGIKPVDDKLASDLMDSYIDYETAQPKKSKLPLFVGLGALALILIGGLVGWMLFGGDKNKGVVNNGTNNGNQKQQPEPVASTAATPKGAIVFGPTGVDSLAKALEQAKAGDRIVVTAAKIEESAVLNVKAKGVTIEGWPETRQVIWNVPAGHDSGRPLVQITNVDNLRIKNIAFEGKQSVDTLVSIGGSATGLNFDNVKFSGYRTAGVDLNAAIGSSNQPIRFDTCRWLGSTLQNNAIRVNKTSTGDATTKSVTVVNCRFEGTESGRLGSALKVMAPVDEFELRQNRFFNLTRGLHYAAKSGSDPTTIGLTVVGNTFFSLSTAFLFDSIPTMGSSLNLFDNLFVKTEVMANTTGIDGRPNCAEGEWICHANDVKRKDGKITGGQIAPGKRYYRKTFEMKELPKEPFVMDISAASSFKVWLNGDPIGESRYTFYDKRVWSFPMAGKLKPGKNVVSVEVSHIADPLNASFQSSSGLMVRIGTEDRDDKVALKTDATWITTAVPSAGWERLAFDDATWTPAHVWNDNDIKVIWPWAGTVWDSAIKAKLAGQLPLTINSTGNFRDYSSNEGFPLLSTARGVVASDPKNFPQDPEDDSTFLRVPRDHKLNSAGGDGKAVGVPLK